MRIAAIVLLAVACSTEVTAPVPVPVTPPVVPDPPAVVVVPVEGVKLTPQSFHFVSIGESRQLAATVAPLDATDRGLTWESTDPAIASVDGNGKVTARRVGFDVFITAITHDGHFQASTVVSVEP